MKKKEEGSIGEALAEKYSKNKGYKILGRNFFSPFGELDLIALDGDVVVFVEVKTRSSKAFGSPIEAITPTKQRNMTKTASYFLQKNNLFDKVKTRFDGVSIMFSNVLDYEIEHIENII